MLTYQSLLSQNIVESAEVTPLDPIPAAAILPAAAGHLIGASLPIPLTPINVPPALVVIQYLSICDVILIEAVRSVHVPLISSKNLSPAIANTALDDAVNLCLPVATIDGELDKALDMYFAVPRRVFNDPALSRYIFSILDNTLGFRSIAGTE